MAAAPQETRPLMNLAFVEFHPQRVLEAFRRGEFDALEVLGQADERDFFTRCLATGLLQRLARSMPTVRDKEEVPRWFILAANLSLKLHQENSFLAFERVVRCGGLLAALPPDLAVKHLDPHTQRWVLACNGFNDKNEYDRATPCDQDTLRKALKDVPATQWLDWFNHPVQEVFQQDGFFDPEGVFVGDASYLFVPDNPAYEGSVLMWFDEHNHPVEYETLTPEQRRHVRQRRCYKWVSLLHLRGQAYVYAGALLLPGNVHEVGPFFDQLVAGFVARVGRGVIKWLLLDRGFVDGQRMSRCQQEWGIAVLIPIKKNLDLWTDAWSLAGRAHWESLDSPAPTPAPIPAQRPDWILRRESQRQHTLAERRAQAPDPDPSEVRTRTEGAVLLDFTSWSAATVPIHVVLLRDHYADGHQHGWALMSTQRPTHPQTWVRLYQRRTAIEERHRQLKCFYDLSQFRSRSFNAIAAQVVMILLTYTLRQWQLWKFFEETLASLTPERLTQLLNLTHQWVVIYLGLAYTQMPLIAFTREVLQLQEPARQKALEKIQVLEQTLWEPLPHPRPS